MKISRDVFYYFFHLFMFLIGATAGGAPTASDGYQSVTIQEQIGGCFATDSAHLLKSAMGLMLPA